jgi:hypothetical protein
MNLELQRANTLAVPTAGAKAMPTGGPPADGAAGPAGSEREYGLYAIVAGHMTPDRAIPVIRKLGIPVADAPSEAAA